MDETEKKIELSHVDQLEQDLAKERARRVDEAVERGEAVRVPLNVICGAEDDLEEARVRERVDKVSELRRAGEQRKPAFDEQIIRTGVPRPGRDEKYVARLKEEYAAESAEQRREREAAAAAVVESFHQGSKSHEPEPNVPPLPPLPPLPPEPSPDLTWSGFVVQVSGPTDSNPGGVVAQGPFAIDGNTLYVEDHEGRRVGSRELSAGDHAKAIAKGLLRDRQKPSAFWQPLDYPRDRLI
jgi:hypothetical protein